jgi:hypothetical protein
MYDASDRFMHDGRKLHSASDDLRVWDVFAGLWRSSYFRAVWFGNDVQLFYGKMDGGSAKLFDGRGVRRERSLRGISVRPGLHSIWWSRLFGRHDV